MKAQNLVFAIVILVVIGAIVLYLFQNGVFSGINLWGGGSTSTKSLNDGGGALKTDDFVPDFWKDFVGSQSYGGGGSKTPKPTSSGPTSGVSSTLTSVIKPGDVPDGFTIDQISPHWDRVRLSSVSVGSASSYNKISLTNNLKSGESLDISGWTIMAKKGFYTIGQAVEVYTTYAQPTNISVRSGQTVNLYSTKSPLGNLRLNKCVGYLETLFDFNPPLSQSCPKPYDDVSDLYQFSSKCQDYLRSLGSCKLPQTNFLWLADDSACRSFMDSISYRGCFEAHQNDADFLSREWRVWMDRRILEDKHDRVLLFDKNRLLVDERIY